MATTRARLWEAAIAAGWAEGRAMTLEQPSSTLWQERPANNPVGSLPNGTGSSSPASRDPPSNAPASATIPKGGDQLSQWHFAGSVPENYERYLVPTIFRPWAAQLIDFAAPQLGERALDVACGTGIVARLVAGSVGPKGRVVGLDSSPAMLAVARSVSPISGTSVEWSEDSALAVPFPDATFNLVLCQQGLQFFPDRPAALHEMHRVLVPDGRLVLSVWRAIQYSPGFAILAEALARHVSSDAGKAMQTPFSLGEVDELRTLVVAAGFRDVTIRPAVKSLRFPSSEDFVRCYVAGSALAGLVAQVSPDIPEALLGDVRQELHNHVDDEGVAFPIEAHIVAARRSGSRAK